MQGTQYPLSDYENEDIDRAIALSLSEEEHKKAKPIGKFYAILCCTNNISRHTIFHSNLLLYT